MNPTNAWRIDLLSHATRLLRRRSLSSLSRRLNIFLDGDFSSQIPNISSFQRLFLIPVHPSNTGAESIKRILIYEKSLFLSIYFRDSNLQKIKKKTNLKKITP